MTGRNRNKQYEVQFQKDGQFHSDTDDLGKAKLYARSLANWNLAAQIYDRLTRRIIFRAQAYAEKKKKPGRAPDCATPMHLHRNEAELL